MPAHRIPLFFPYLFNSESPEYTKNSFDLMVGQCKKAMNGKQLFFTLISCSFIDSYSYAPSITFTHLNCIYQYSNTLRLLHGFN